MRLPFLRSKSEAADAPVASVAKGRARASVSPAAPDEGQAVAAARSQARRRLVGAVVLLAIGIVGFPILFETQPRPLPLDTPIETAARAPAEAAPPLPATPVNARPQLVPTVPADAGVEPVPEPASAASAPLPTTAPTPSSMPSTTPAPTLASRPAAPQVGVVQPAADQPAPVASVATPPAPPAAPAAPAAASAAAPAASSAGRFVVQVGAYSDAAMLREARGKVEKLGLKTYTQVIDNDAGKRTRVRIGPFATREEADAAAAKVKRTGLPANILVL